MRKPVASIEPSPVWLLGDGRSGTTWVAKLINHTHQYKVLFEPFHPHKVDAMSFLLAHQYVPLGKVTPMLEQTAKSVFSGDFLHPRVQRPTRNSNDRRPVLVKDIFANLLAYSVCEKLTHVKPVLLLRNPFAVAASKQKKSHWSWYNSPGNFLKQPNLMHDFLSSQQRLIEEIAQKKDPYLDQILTWAIINYVPLSQFSTSSLYVLFYENVYLNPDKQIRELLQFVTPTTTKLVQNDKEIGGALIDNPSKPNDVDSTIHLGESPITAWQHDADLSKNKAGLEILQAFGLDTLYNSDGLPSNNALKSFAR